MTDKDKTELLTNVLHALFDYKFKGGYLVEVKLTTVVDADNVKDAQAKGLAYAKEHPEELKAWAMKISNEEDK